MMSDGARLPPRTLLSPEQRTRVFAIPSESVELVRHCVPGAYQSDQRLRLERGKPRRRTVSAATRARGPTSLSARVVFLALRSGYDSRAWRRGAEQIPVNRQIVSRHAARGEPLFKALSDHRT